MIIRHRPPTIFSIYMVDVLCCALGCVILLWQLYHTESEEQTAKARDANARLDRAGLDIHDLTGERDKYKKELAVSAMEGKTTLAEKLKALDSLAEATLSLSRLMAERDDLDKDLETTKREKVLLSLDLKGFKEKLDKKTKLALVLESELKTLRATHAAAEALIAGLKIDYADLAKKSTVTSTELAAKLKAHAEVLSRAALLEKRLTALEKELKTKSVELVLADGKLDLSEKKLEDAETRAKRIENLYAELQALAKESLSKITISDLRLKMLELELKKSRKELTGSGKRIEDLLSVKDLLTLKLLASAKDLVRLREEADRRFEGITLDGKKVVFLIDISGSMVRRDEDTLDPTKWPRVVETIERFAASLAEAEQFQVVVFSTGAKILLGDRVQWEKFDRATSPKKIGDALRALNPDGGTNLFAGLEKAFAFRPLGLESLYVFSDGLPTEGPGVRKEEETLSVNMQSEKRGKWIRQQLKTIWNPERAAKRVRINAVGFYFESPDLGAFLWSLARENEGSFVGMSRP